MVEVKHFLRIRKKPEEVFQAINTESGVQGWWTEGAKKQGNNWEFSFGKYGKMSMESVESEEHEEIEWKYSRGDMEDDPWKGSSVRFGLEAEGSNTTILRFSHDNLNCDGEVLANINYNWGRFLFSLKTYVETGKGFPVES